MMGEALEVSFKHNKDGAPKKGYKEAYLVGSVTLTPSQT